MRAAAPLSALLKAKALSSAQGVAQRLQAAAQALPSQCAVCRQWGSSLVCSACIPQFAQPHPRCAQCGLRLGLATPRCGACLRQAPPFSRTVCAVDYGFPWDGLITAFKFHHQVELADALAARLQEAVQAAGAAHEVDAVVPVPLSPRRLRERGYNQAWELARRCALAFSLPADAKALQRSLDTPAQAALHRAERERNLRNAFHMAPAARRRWAGHRLALVDDVMTTGATLREATAALLRGGAASVQLWVLARTPDD